MGARWRDCIVSVIDLVGIKSRADRGVRSDLMRKLHALVIQEVPGLPTVAHAYACNDSVLLLSFVTTERHSFEAALRDADRLKHRVDRISPSFAVAIKGRTFPPVRASVSVMQGPRVTVVEASSWAMANSLEIPAKVQPLRGTWYIDDRVARRIRTKQPHAKKAVPFLPSKTPRTVRVYKDYLWNEV
jgi:hypothetical protein